MARPGDDEPVAQRLWDAMADHYKGELRKPVATTPADWERIGREWETFLEVRRKGQAERLQHRGWGDPIVRWQVRIRPCSVGQRACLKSEVRATNSPRVRAPVKSVDGVA